MAVHEESVRAPRLREAGAGLDWRELLVWSALGLSAVLVATIVASGSIFPPVLVFAVLFAVGAFLARGGGKPGTIVLLVASVAMTAMLVPFAMETVVVPASTVDFLTSSLALLLSAVVVISAVAQLRRREGNAARAVGTAAVLAAVLLVGVAVVARVGYDSPVAQAGDVKIATQDFEFTSTEIRAIPRDGKVTVFVDNQDSALHTFTIKELGVDLTIPGGSTGRVTFQAPDGSYEFVCEPHAPDMKGTLEVN